LATHAHVSFALLLLATGLACRPGGEDDEAGDAGESTTSETSEASETSESSGESESGAATSSESGPADTTSESGSETGGLPSWPQPCADLYAQDSLPTFTLDFTPADWQALQWDCEQGGQNYFPVEFGYAGESVAAMARLKGNWSYDCNKYQFVISFNEQDPNGRFHGLRKIMLDAPWYEQSFLHERVAFPLFEALGLPYSCVNNARLDINGAYYGLYVNVERIDQEYLERNFEAPEGNLYQGGVELKTNELENDTSRRDALFAATSVDEIAALMDLDQAVAEWAAEAMLPALDNYWAGVEINYYLYDHPTRGFVYLPYDLDIAFGDNAYGDGSLLWPGAEFIDPITYEHPGWLKEPLMQIVLSDTYWCERFVEALGHARAAYDPDAMAEQVSAWADQIEAALLADPHKTFPSSDHTIAIDRLEAFFADRAEFVDAWLAQGNHCPGPW
jgi:hypothetical protein